MHIFYFIFICIYIVCTYFYLNSVKGLGRSKVIETIAVDIDTIDIGEPLSNDLIMTTDVSSPFPPPTQSPAAITTASQPFNGGLMNGGIVLQEGRMNGTLMEEKG